MSQAPRIYKGRTGAMGGHRPAVPRLLVLWEGYGHLYLGLLMKAMSEDGERNRGQEFLVS